MLTRLAMGIVEQEDDDVTTEKLDKALVELSDKKVRDKRVSRGERKSANYLLKKPVYHPIYVVCVEC